MLIIEHSIETTASSKAVWEIWSDVVNWNTWDQGIEYTTTNGPFQTGTTGTLKPKGGPLVHVKLTSVEPMKSFKDEAKLPLARLIMDHRLEEKNGKRVVTHRIEMKGPLAFFFAFVIGRNMKKDLPHEMKNLIIKAEQITKSSS